MKRCVPDRNRKSRLTPTAQWLVVVQIGERGTSVLREFERLTRGIHIPRSPICTTTQLLVSRADGVRHIPACSTTF